MSTDNKVKDIINNLKKKYETSSWKDILNIIFDMEEFSTAIYQLLSDHTAGHKFTPTVKDLFKSLDLCTLQAVKIIIINNLPETTGKCDGLAFSGYPNAFKQHLGITEKNLDYLPKQGVLLLNASITALQDMPENHVQMWQPIFQKLIDEIAYRTTGTAFVFVGDDVQDYSKTIRKGQTKFFIPSVKDEQYWKDIDVFEYINNTLISKKIHPVNWKNVIS